MPAVLSPKESRGFPLRPQIVHNVDLNKGGPTPCLCHTVIPNSVLMDHGGTFGQGRIRWVLFGWILGTEYRKTLKIWRWGGVTSWLRHEIVIPTRHSSINSNKHHVFFSLTAIMVWISCLWRFITSFLCEWTPVWQNWNQETEMGYLNMTNRCVYYNHGITLA